MLVLALCLVAVVLLTADNTGDVIRCGTVGLLRVHGRDAIKRHIFVIHTTCRLQSRCYALSTPHQSVTPFCICIDEIDLQKQILGIIMISKFACIGLSVVSSSLLSRM